MARFIRIVLAALGLAGAIPAQSAFHLFAINELYSNADGSVQFIEMQALAGGQQFVQAQQITTSNGSGATRSFTFPSNLPGDTSGKTFLIGTQGFAALGVVTPDFVVPNGFLFQGGGTVTFAGGADVWNHPPLPTDNRSIARAGNTAQTPTPRNFNGITGTIPASGGGGDTPNFQGLWYRGEVESGWGVNIAHQGEIIFATWFTYDADGSQMWLVGSDVRKGTGNTFTGALYRTTGPAFNSQPFTPITAANITQVGTITFNFTDASNGTMTYTVNGVTQSKPIVRQVFGPLPTCESNGSQGATLN
ncbi:MAG TPA: hypothetical protein VFV90_09780, partial [Usitatibacter sp.]|nr:hypothetical protein [Usitatibacter sp.]